MWKNNPNTLGQIVQPNDSSTLIRFQKVNGQFVSRHDLQLVVTTAFGCMDTIEKAIFLKPLPVIKLSDTLPSLCVPGTVTLKNDSNRLGLRYSWTSLNAKPGSNFSSSTLDSLHAF
jgi:hypothetical protein